MKKCKCVKRITRQSLANPHSDMTYHERLVKSGAIDLRDNHKVIDLGNGFIKIVAIDTTKLVK